MVRGHFSVGEGNCLRGQLSGGQLFRGNHPGGNYPGSNYPGGNFPRWQLSQNVFYVSLKEELLSNVDYESMIIISKRKFNCPKPIFSKRSHRKCSVGQALLKNFAKFTGKHLCHSLFFNKVAALSLLLCQRRGSGTGDLQ